MSHKEFGWKNPHKRYDIQGNEITSGTNFEDTMEYQEGFIGNAISEALGGGRVLLS